MPNKRGKHDVHIFEADGDFRVRPAVISVGDDYKLGIRNFTDCPALLRFPTHLKVLIGQNQVIYHVLDRNDRVDLEFGSGNPKDRPADGVYTYQVDMLKEGADPKPARGESGPRIIIDP